ncbi:MAG: hypothetical protein JG781_282 [Peptococcaceae bacterium]|jgi:L-asparaginase/Glu-tRNA(Gln) amidotransferase subunit D|nr:hypothetical protein [Peptococcaceae bacterium]
MASKIILLATGGTIATMADLEKGGLVARLDGETLLRNANMRKSMKAGK